jgi:hypothetical protein
MFRIKESIIFDLSLSASVKFILFRFIYQPCMSSEYKIHTRELRKMEEITFLSIARWWGRDGQ